MHAINIATGSAASTDAVTTNPPPFLKWAGGKRWLISSHSSLLQVSYSRYIEPFLGSGAVYFHLRPKSAVLGDMNAALIQCYAAVRESPSAVEAALARHQRQHSETYYYEERRRKHRSPAEAAAQLIYLNRTCWNGLYRVNLKGEFNVPIGTKENVILSSDNFQSTSRALQGAQLFAQDFEATIDRAEDGDLLFADPPYTVKHNYNGFLKYNEKIFSWDDQKRLRGALERAKDRGVRILLLNADHASIRDLYRGFGEHLVLSRNSVLAGDAAYRGKSTELAIRANY